MVGTTPSSTRSSALLSSPENQRAKAAGADQRGHYRHADGLHADHPQAAQQYRHRQRKLHLTKALPGAHAHCRRAFQGILRYLLQAGHHPRTSGSSA